MANNVSFPTIIDAIKAVRGIPLGRISLEPDETGRVYVHVQALGLKEAKDVTEAIMALGVRRYLADELAKANREAQAVPVARDAQGFPAYSYRDAQDGDDDIRF